MYTDLWLVRYDEAGNKVWKKQYGGFHEDIAYNITPMPDGVFWWPGTPGKRLSTALPVAGAISGS
jgi:hypothetical protein